LNVSHERARNAFRSIGRRKKINRSSSARKFTRTIVRVDTVPYSFRSDKTVNILSRRRYERAIYGRTQIMLKNYFSLFDDISRAAKITLRRRMTIFFTASVVGGYTSMETVFSRNCDISIPYSSYPSYYIYIYRRLSRRKTNRRLLLGR